MEVTSILIDSAGNLVGDINISSLPWFKILMLNLGIKPNYKKLLANTGDKNYLFWKMQVEINNSTYDQFFIEEWRMLQSLSIVNQSPHSRTTTPQELVNYNSFNPLEQEVIYALLNGYITDKEIDVYLSQFSKQVKGNIKYTISMLFSRFDTSNRADLVHLLKIYALDRYLPASLFPTGVYDL